MIPNGTTGSGSSGEPRLTALTGVAALAYREASDEKEQVMRIRVFALLSIAAIIATSLVAITGTWAAGCTIRGTNGDDRLRGTSGNDVICGRGGDDTIMGRGGADTLFGDDGRDWIWAGGGNDTVQGGANGDWVYGGNGDDVVDGGAGRDWMVSGDLGSDSIYGNYGNDRCIWGYDGTGGNDSLFGGDGTDTWYSDIGDVIAGDLEIYAACGAE